MSKGGCIFPAASICIDWKFACFHVVFTVHTHSDCYFFFVRFVTVTQSWNVQLYLLCTLHRWLQLLYRDCTVTETIKNHSAKSVQAPNEPSQSSSIRMNLQFISRPNHRRKIVKEDAISLPFAVQFSTSIQQSPGSIKKALRAKFSSVLNLQ